MNASKSSATPWNWEQKLGVVLFAALFIGWSSASAVWKNSSAGKGLFFLLLPAFGLMLYLLDRKAWTQINNKDFFFILLAVWLGLFQFLGNSLLGYIHTPSLFSWMYEAYNSTNPANDDGHGDFIPFVVIGLLWWKRKDLLAQPWDAWWPGLVLLILAMVLHVMGYVLQQPRISIVALVMGLYGLTGLSWGRNWLRKCFFPFFLLVFLIPLGDQAKFITFPLRLLVSQLVELVSHWILGIDVIRAGTQLFDPTGSYGFDVEAPCSGIRSLVSIFLLAAVYGFITFRSAWIQIFLMALAFPFAVLGNLLRMLCIIIAAALGGQEAGNYVHEGCPIHLPLLGDVAIVNLLPYVPAIVGLLWIGRWIEKRWKSEREEHA